MLQEQIKSHNIQSLPELCRLKDGTMTSGRVIVTKQLFFNEASGFGSYLCAFEGSEDKVSVSGVFLDKPEECRTYWVRGERSTYKTSPQIKAHQFELAYPETTLSNYIFLFSIPALSRYATRIIKVYPNNAVESIINKPYEELIDSDEFKLYETQEPGFLQTLKAEQENLKALFVKSLMLSKLTGLNLSKTAARKIYGLFEMKSYDMLSKNPYVLLEYFEDLGYNLSFCDSVAMKFGFKANSELRFEYGVIHAIQASGQMGHVYMPKEEFLDFLKGELSVSVPADKLHHLLNQHQQDFVFEYFNQSFIVSYDELKQLMCDRANFVNNAHEKSIVLFMPTEKQIRSALTSAIKNNLVVEYKGRIYSRNLYEKEMSIAEKIDKMLKDESANSMFRQHPYNIQKLAEKYTLEKQQLTACVEFLAEPGGLYIVTGPAGSGKTYLIKSLINTYLKLYKKKKTQVMLMAPTGRAAKRIEDSTGFSASTIHRGLGMSEGNYWAFNEGNPLEHSIVIVDEFSMVDTEMAYRLFSAIKTGTKVILVGDIHQLFPVGPGNVLRDLIESKRVPLVELNVVKRQQADSDIIDNAVRVIAKQPLYEGGKNKDAFVLYRSHSDKIQQTLITSIQKIQSARGLGLEQIQVIVPQRKSRVGTFYINHLIQSEFNPNPDGAIIANQFSVYDSSKKKYEDITTYYRVGDKVINVKNNYRAMWYDKNALGEYVQDSTMTIITNGEIGVIEEIVKPKKAYGEKFTYRIIVKIDNKYIFFDDDFDNLELAYAITVHKSQGSQWKSCIVLVSGAHKRMLTNNLIYTALTRPSDFLVVIGDEAAIRDGINNDVIEKRYTTLSEYLKESVS